MQKNLQQLQKRLTRQHKHHHVASMYTLGVFTVGSAIGIAAGMLMAPDNGRATRTRLGTQTRRGFDASRWKLMALKANLLDKMNRANEKTKNAMDKSKRAVQESKTRPTTTPAAPAM